MSIEKRLTKRGEVRYDVRIRIGGRVVTRSFRRRKDADAYAATVEADRLRGVAIDPRRGRVTVREYAEPLLRQRSDLAETTAALYRHVLDRHILPTFGAEPIGKVTPSGVRSWHADLAAAHPATAAKAYRLLSGVMRAAVADELIARNPCQVQGASVERAPERPVASIAEVHALADAMPDHLRVAVLLAAWCQLRRGELLGLRRRDVDLLHGTVAVERTRTFTMAGEPVTKGPKTDAGRRTLAVPPTVLPDLRRHLDRYVGPEPDAPVLMGERGGPLHWRTLAKAWDRARRSIGRPKLHLHDLRHAGLTWAATTGATVAELMHRAGHASPAAALRYQHATRDRDRALADALADLERPAPVAELRATALDARDGRAMEPPEREGSRGENPG